MSDRPAIFDIVDMIHTYCVSKSFPEVKIDFLNDSGNSIAICQTSSPVVEKEYINGSCINRLEFEVLIQGSVEDKLMLKEVLTDICLWFQEMKDEALTQTRKILSGTSTFPSIRNLTDNCMCQFGISVVLKYKED